MSPDAELRMVVYQEGQRSARDENALCPYGLFDWRQGTWWKGRKAAQDYNAAVEATLTQQAEPVAELRADIKGGGYVHFLSDKVFAEGTKLYAAPQQAEPVVCAICEIDIESQATKAEAWWAKRAEPVTKTRGE
jgi:hypothetical protein